ncbi:general odorant-binding protein 19d-like [Toxorhynchites rutilus septentrionalis]|uniref:general odorant-binding protein 19d-like n=1 Tax=Toxorhynchites rutilus septentrionalis TaxID=329112 RepID=UPI00247AAE34|nr:general odorant-binding protein 19d-like [Toxorhynchites rutilus septentrionalis]
MKNSYYFFLVVCLVLTCSKGDSTEEENEEHSKDMLRSLASECKNTEGATDEDVEAMVEHKMPKTQVQKCFHSCLQQQFGISDGEKFLKKGFIELSEMLLKKDEEKMTVAEEIAIECDGIANPDRCQLAVDIMSCVEHGMEKRGIQKHR